MKLLKLIKSVIVVTSLFTVFAAFAAETSQVIPYYGDDFYADLKADVSSEDLKIRLKTVLRSYHVLSANGNDQIVKACPTSGVGRCYSHQTYGYGPARVFLMGGYYLVKDGASYAIRDVYCDKVRPRSDFGSSPPNPGSVPNNTVINIEHTWPQSHFTNRFSDEMQKSDMHHLFPTDSQLNAIRGNNMFGEVSQDLADLKCPASRFGLGSAGTDEVFEPPQVHKGNVARALFYFSVRYDLGIDPREEVILRKWHHEDPVDADEIKRNEAIYKAQGNRNPFIDFPELVEKVNNF